MRFLLKIVGFLPVLCMFDAGAAVRAGAGGNTNSTGRISVSPSIGVKSILKSPEWKITPAGVVIISPIAPLML